MRDRVKPFENISNFRDFGGYQGADGRMVKTGILFRSAQFGEATEADLAALETYNITVQADLRRPDERERHGHRWPTHGVNILKSDKGRATEAPHVRFLSEVAVDVDKANGWMVDYYRAAPFKEQHTDTFKAWFDELAALEPGQAAVVNCAAGKDRTGMLCAMTHHLLGVSREDIFADYDLTNEAADVATRLPEMARMFNQHIGKDHPEDVYQPFVGVQDIFLEAAIEAIETKAGSLDAYLSDYLGINATKREALRARLLD